MNILIQVFRSFPLIAVGLYLVYDLTKDPAEDFIFDFIWAIGKIIIGAIIFFWTLKNNHKNFKESKSILSFLPVISTIFLSLTFWIFQSIKTQTVLFARINDAPTQSFLKLRKDGTYQFGNGSVLGNNYFYGQYELHDTIITLDKSVIDKVIISNKLLIKPYKGSLYPENDTVLYQLDKEGKVLVGATYFWLREDNRKLNVNY